MKLDERPFHFEKKAGKTVKGGRLNWEEAIMSMLAETAPFVVGSGNEIQIQWDEMDPENGYAIGKVVCHNRPPLPPVMPGQLDQLRRAGISDPGKAVTIPVYVKDSELSDVDIFIDDQGAAHSLTEKRWNEFMGTHEPFGAIDPNVNPASIRPQNPTYQLPQGAAGYDRIGGNQFGGEKTSSESGYPLIREAIGTKSATMDPVDKSRMMEQAKCASILSGFGVTRVYPIVRLLLSSPSCGLEKHEGDVLDLLPINLVFVQEINGGAVRSARFRVTMVSDRYYRPKIAEGDYRFVVELLSGVIPDIAQRMKRPGDHVFSIGRMPKASPIVLEDMKIGAERALGRGNFLVLDRCGESLMHADVVPNVFEWSGQPSGHKLVIGPRCWSMCSDVAGRRVAEFGESVKVALSDGHLERGYWVSLVMGDPMDHGSRWMVPAKVLFSGLVFPQWDWRKGPAPVEPAQIVGSAKVVSSGAPDVKDGKRRVIHMVTYAGEELAVMFVPGILKAMPVSGAKWPDIDLDDGCSRWLVPMDTVVADLGIPTTVETDPREMDSFVNSHVMSQSRVESSGGRIRFVADDGAERVRTLSVEHHGVAGGFSMRGEILRGVTGQSTEHDLTQAQAKFNLMVLGCSDEDASAILSRAESKERITVSGLRPVERFIDVDGTRRAPFFRKMAELAMRLRSEITGAERDVLFKSAAAIPFADLSGPVVSFLMKEASRRRLAFLGSQLAKACEYGSVGVEKVAEIFSEPDSVDVMLGLNILNERNVKTFLRHLDRLRRVEDNLAELLMMSRQGLAGLESRDAAEALAALNKVNEKLEQLKVQLGQDALVLS